MIYPRQSTYASLVGAACLATTMTMTTTMVQAQLTIGIPGIFEVNLTVPEEIQAIFEDDDATGGNNNATTGDDADDDDGFNFDFEAIFNELGDFIGESLDNFTLPPELEDLFQLPNFDNVSFSFGGNCSICDSMEAGSGFVGTNDLDGISCDDWSKVATLGVAEGSDQCDLLRVGAAQSCGCPVPEAYAAKTCSVCPDGQASSEWQASLGEEILAVTCSDLESAPAVDGDRTCELISQFTSRCNCTSSLTATGSSGNGNTDSSESAVSGASPIMPMKSLVVFGSASFAAVYYSIAM